MEYTIRELADLAGVTPRTLRWYDQTGLLKPSRTDNHGCRFYAAAEVDRLQHILFYRALGVELAQIRRLLDDPSFDRSTALRAHLDALQERREHLDRLISTVQRTLNAEERKEKLMDHEIFEGFKRSIVAENEQKYGTEVRSRYGNESVDASNAQILGMTQEQHAEWMQLGEEILNRLEAAVRTGEDPTGPSGWEIAQLHRRWLMFTWTKYSPQAHTGLAQMYVADERFRDYYDSRQSGCAQFLRDAIVAACR